MPETIVVYHSPCYDGFGAAYAAWKKFGNQARYIPAQYGMPMPDIPDKSDVIMVDFSYPRQVLLDLESRLNSLIVLDHHKSAQEDLIGLDFAIFDLHKSGARITWEYLFPDKKIPEFLLYVEDRDLWRFNLPQSKEVNDAIQSYPLHFIIWDQFNIETLKSEGVGISRFKIQQVEHMCKNLQWGHLNDYFVPYVNATVFYSEVCTKLLQLNENVPFAVSYYIRSDGKYVWSLRSRSDFDVSQVATRMGGGGHPQAAGFTSDTFVIKQK